MSQCTLNQFFSDITLLMNKAEFINRHGCKLFIDIQFC